VVKNWIEKDWKKWIHPFVVVNITNWKTECNLLTSALLNIDEADFLVEHYKNSVQEHGFNVYLNFITDTTKQRGTESTHVDELQVGLGGNKNG
jgi:hypothetical protein